MDKEKRNKQIIKMHEAGKRNPEIAKKFNTTPQNVSYILRSHGHGKARGPYNQALPKEAFEREIRIRKDAALSTIARLNQMQLDQEVYDLIEVLIRQVADFAGLQKQKERVENILLFKGYDYDEDYKCNRPDERRNGNGR